MKIGFTFDYEVNFKTRITRDGQITPSQYLTLGNNAKKSFCHLHAPCELKEDLE
jgi:hypothetical protein